MKVLCHSCSATNRSAFYHLLFRVRGQHVCHKCGRKFTVTFTPTNNKVEVNHVG